MPTFVALLRAVNLGGRRTFSPSEIRACVEGLGWTGVATHINTGNVVLTTSLRSPERVRTELERAFAADRGFEVPVVVLTPAELSQVAADLDEVGAGHPGLHHVSFLQTRPDEAAVAAVHGWEPPGERIVVRDRAAHLLGGPTTQGSRVTNTAVERRLGVVATARTSTVVRAMAAKWGSGG